MSKKFCAITALVLMSVPLAAQVAPSGQGKTETGSGVWVGATFSVFNPDYGCTDGSPFSCGDKALYGVGPYVYTNYFIHGRVGVEGEARLLLWHGPGTLIQNSFLAGPRVRLFSSQNLFFSGKFLLGSAHLDVPGHLLGAGAYFAYAPGAVIDYRVTKHVAARVEYEYQFWPGYKCFRCTGGAHGGLTPNGFGFGMSYQIPLPHSASGVY